MWYNRRDFRKEGIHVEEMLIRPIAHIYTSFEEKFGLPRQSGLAEGLMGRVVFTPEYRDPEALRGIENYAYLWLIFDFSRAHREKWSPTVRPPRLGGNRRLGVFASRSPFRPNSLGLSSVKLEAVLPDEGEGKALLVSGVDMLSGTPIYDVKPYLPYTDSHPDARGSGELFPERRLRVIFPEELAERLPEALRRNVLDCLAQDPRPSYQDDPERIYGMRIGGVDVRFRVSEGTALVVDVAE